MSERRENEEQEVNEYEEEEEDTDTNVEPGGNTVEQPAEDDREPGRRGEEEQEDRTTPDVLEAAEEAASDLQDGLIGPGNSVATETQADLSHDAEQLGEPQRTEHVGNSTATVKVVLVPEGHVMTVAFAIGLSIAQLKLHLANELRVPADVLHIFLDGRAVDEQQSLMELGVRPNGSTRMEMSSIDPDSHPLRPLRPPEQDMPDVITVRVQTEENMFREVVVEIERPPQQKAFLGGFKHRLTGAQYHHAAVQTLPKRRADRGVVLFSRNTQTVELQSEGQQCPLDASTQMTGIGCYVSCMDDKLVAPGNYITADQYHEERLRAVVVLQTFARRWLALQEVQRLRRDRDRRLVWLELQERKRREEKEEQLKDRRRRWVNPQRREDFNLLYHALEKWRSEEEQQINSSLRGAERKAALCFLLETETQLIAAIGHHRIAVQNNNYDKVVRNLLDKSAAPHQWRAADGRLIEMDSEHTVRAAELRDLYNNINLSSESQEQRLEHLLTLRHTIKEHECQLTRDIVDLIDREADLMTRQVKVASLQGLRKRISTLFLQFIKTPAFNPEVAKHLKVPQDPSQLKNDMFQCRGCQRYLQSSDFSPTAGARLSGRCRDCTGLDNIARSRDDFSCYRNILRRLRSDEMRLNQDAKIPFLLQVEDVRYLVEVLWASRSALHSSSDLYSLVFVRWEKRRVWSPWNCILLSKEETSAHLEVDDVHKAYEVTFLRRVDHKHMLARRHFTSVPVMAEHLEPTATLGNQLVSKPVTMATGKPTAHTPAGSAH
ncbi:LOW QUALITY PROTEIN: IQ and ubiquitin-like domain-containing protein [Gymnodraco acuticeps]|uniref:LOW QUALITY PROTEIN: IQ and ubiquitin-like domain-containing protein n=1 Tax=Gymnodraco acuticeps TaxID=8218 RepID=A0A6P8V573_GYMAC|nr:LOW QUALITY PROTEIN: IQ and ubiquitin-like domain-containing protein [Gymnodraco acuticeps]